MNRRAMFIVTDASTTIFLRGQVEFLRDGGFECVVVSSPGPQPEQLRGDRIAVESAPLERQPSPVSDLRALVRLVRLMRAYRPTLVNASTPKAAILGMIAAFACRVPVRVYQCRGHRFELMTGPSRVLYMFFERASAALATHVLFNSESLRQASVSQHLVTPQKAHLIGHGSSNGVEIERFRPDSQGRSATRAALAIPPQAPVLGFVGRLVGDKGIEPLVRIFQRLRRAHPGLRLLLVGDVEPGDPLPDALRRVITGDPDITVTGFVDDTAPLYRAMDVLVFPSLREGLPNAPLEAQATAVPVVAYAATGTVDAVEDGAGGRLVDVGDEKALEAAVHDLLVDRDARAAVGRAARRWVTERFDRRSVWRGTCERYENWLKTAGVP